MTTRESKTKPIGLSLKSSPKESNLEDLFRQHVATDVQSLNRWLIVLLAATIQKQGGELKLDKKELDRIDKGWAVDYCYDDEQRVVTLRVRPGPATETYVVGEKASGGTQPYNPRLDAAREEPRSVTLSDEQLAKMEQRLERERRAHEMETGEWVENPQS